MGTVLAPLALPEVAAAGDAGCNDPGGSGEFVLYNTAMWTDYNDAWRYKVGNWLDGYHSKSNLKVYNSNGTAFFDEDFVEFAGHYDTSHYSQLGIAERTQNFTGEQRNYRYFRSCYKSS